MVGAHLDVAASGFLEYLILMLHFTDVPVYLHYIAD